MPHTPYRVAFRRPWPGKRRGLKLWFIAIILGLKGVGYVAGRTSNATDEALRLFTAHMPIQVVGLGILFVCLVAGFCSYCHYGRDVWGYAILTGYVFGWAATYAVAPVFDLADHVGGWPFWDSLWYVLGHYPGTLVFGSNSAWQGMLTYVAIGVFLLISAGDPEPVALSELPVVGPTP